MAEIKCNNGARAYGHDQKYNLENTCPIQAEQNYNISRAEPSL